MKSRGQFLGSAALVVFLGACDAGGCGGCLAPLPDGITLPTDQTVDGGAQIRITPTGFDKLTSIVPAVLNDTLGDGFCIPDGDVGIGIGDIDWCYTNDGTCAPGCQADFSVDFINISVNNANQLTVSAQFDVDVDVAIRFDPIVFGDVTCNMDATANNIALAADITFGINPTTGELELNLEDIGELDINLNLANCGIVDDVLEFVADIIFGALSVDFIRDLLQPLLEDLVQGFLPNPLGLVGMIDGGSLLPGVAPETNANIEARLVPGGYVFLEGNGMSLGIITGINADEDQTTRTAALDSEPALCVPPFAAPDFAAAPHNLSTSIRGNFNLLPAGAFRGSPDPSGTDLVIGASETTLDLLGHHLAASGGMCLGLGSELSDQLNLGTFGLLVPSLAELGDNSAPMLLVTRPLKPIDFSVGAGTEVDPAINMSISSFEIDFYAFIFDRYTRAFTVTLDVDVGINLEFALDAEGNPAVIPMLVGLESGSIGLAVHNAEFLREPAADLEAVLPTLLDAVLPLLTDGLGPITLPDFAGFTLTNLGLSKVTTAEDDFVAISAELGASTALTRLGEHYPSVATIADSMRGEAGNPVVASARLASVTALPPADIRAGLVSGDKSTLPTLVMDVDTHDANGQPLEWAWNINGSIWRPFRTPTSEGLVIADRAFVLQGHYTIELMSRVVGDYTTTMLEPIAIPVTIDSAPPRIYHDSVAKEDGIISVKVEDLVTDRDDVEVAFGAPLLFEPTTDWGRPEISEQIARDIAQYGSIKVYARDLHGNVTSEEVDFSPVLYFHGSGTDEGGCNCDIGSADSGSLAGGIAMLLLTLVLIGLPRRRAIVSAITTAARRKVGFLGTLLGLAVIGNSAACSCGSDAGGDDPLTCDEGQVITCFDEEMLDCTCIDEIPYGNIGEFSEIAIAPNGNYFVSAYNKTHGDLMVAEVSSPGRIADESWQFVDGVPDGPVVEGRMVRGGIDVAGPDVGLYTDITVASSGTVLVSYFDNDGLGLKVATLANDVWGTHEVDSGIVGELETAFEVAGQYSAIAVRPADERPVIAYFVSIGENGEARTELRVARANTALPASPSDWTIEVVETMIVDDAAVDILTIPKGVGLFVNMTLDANGEPVLVYYDRVNGDLKLAMADETGALIPTILDGDLVDVGWYPGVLVDDAGVVHVSYVSASNDDLLYINNSDLTSEIVDDGYRIVGTTDDGLPKPEFHFVGDDSSIVDVQGDLRMVYQNATTHELLVAGRNPAGAWQWQSVAGNEDPFVGGYGFYASAQSNGTNIAMSTYVVDHPNRDAWVEVFNSQIIIE